MQFSVQIWSSSVYTSCTTQRSAPNVPYGPYHMGMAYGHSQCRTRSASIPWTLLMGPVNLQSLQFVPGPPLFLSLNSVLAPVFGELSEPACRPESVTSLARFASCSVCPPSSTLIRPKSFVIANHFPCTLARPPPVGETYPPSNLTA